MFDKIKLSLPNIPDEAIKDWLLPFADELGWPPLHERWPFILGQPISSWQKSPIDFWQNTSWTKESLDLSNINLAASSRDSINKMFKAYSYGEDNLYKRRLGEGGKSRFMSAVKYIIEHGNLPKPPIFLKESDEYKIIDGNHRFLAWQSVEILYKQFAVAPENMRREFLRSLSEKWKITQMAKMIDTHEVWVAISDS